jgi:hypothetical protein
MAKVERSKNRAQTRVYNINDSNNDAQKNTS